MQRKLAITLDEEVCEGMNQVVGPRPISRFVEDEMRPHGLNLDLEAAYAGMARDEEREQAALEWQKPGWEIPAVRRGELWRENLDRLPQERPESSVQPSSSAMTQPAAPQARARAGSRLRR